MTDAPTYTIERAGPQAVPPCRRSFVLLKDIEANPRKDWLIMDMLGAGELSFFYGAPGSGKSVVVADMAAHVAAGLDWQGHRTTQGAVLIIAAERGGLVKRRLAAWRKRHGIADAPLAVVSAVFNLWDGRKDVAEICAIAEEVSVATGHPRGLAEH